MIVNQFDVEFRKDGSLFDEGQVPALTGGLAAATDLLVLVHGWNNDKVGANALYDALLTSLRQLPQPTSGRASKICVLRTFWPSKEFADADIVPGGGAAWAQAENDEALLRVLEALKRDPECLGEPGDDPARAGAVDGAIGLVDDLDVSQEARREFVRRIRAVLDVTQAHEDDGSREFFERDPEELFDLFSRPVPRQLAQGEGGAAAASGGGAAFLGDLLSGIMAAARRIANFATYYEMKTRAGTVGRVGLAAVLRRVREQHPQLPIHLVGHSFGGRLVTAAVSVHEPGGAPTTLTLLQAAFSHNGLGVAFDGVHDGAFRTVLGDHRISGPVAITHTKNDEAVGIAFPLASRIARDNSAALGDRNDPYGGMGRNGAQHTPEVRDMEAELWPVDRTPGYAFSLGGVFNLNADRIIKHHSDVKSPAVAKVVLAVAVTG